jgi:hypothetical protein
MYVFLEDVEAQKECLRNGINTLFLPTQTDIKLLILLLCLLFDFVFCRSKYTAGKQRNMEVVFRTGCLRMFPGTSGDLPVLSRQKSTEKSGPDYCFHIPLISRSRDTVDTCRAVISLHRFFSVYSSSNASKRKIIKKL